MIERGGLYELTCFTNKEGTKSYGIALSPVNYHHNCWSVWRIDANSVESIIDIWEGNMKSLTETYIATE